MATEPTDAITRLAAHITGRLEVARAVCREPEGIVWRTERDRYDGSKYSLWEVMAPDLADPMGWVSVDPEVVAYLDIHHTADAVRRYLRDLRTLGRHTPTVFTGQDAERFGTDPWCWTCRGRTCHELPDLFAAYPDVRP